MELFIPIATIIITSALIFFLGNRFALASTRIGDILKMTRAVKGATLDAVASSLPELLVALFAVVFFQSFEVGIGTIAGSALFNLLIIPGIAVLVAPVAFKVHKQVINRDALFYIISVFILVVITFYYTTWGFAIAFVLLGTYLYYLHKIRYHSKRGDDPIEKPEKGVSLSKEIWVAIGLVVGIGIVTYFLTEASIELAHVLDISPIIIAFLLTAAATSVPDTVISVVNARKGNIDDAASNVFGSNTFDILVGLGLPLIIYNIFVGDVSIVFNNIEILFGLLGATILVLHFFADDLTLNKKNGVLMIFLYIAFAIYILSLAFK